MSPIIALAISAAHAEPTTHRFTVEAPVGAPSSSEYATSVAISEAANLFAVGDPGDAYSSLPDGAVDVYDNATGDHLMRLHPDDSSRVGPSFGASLDFSQDGSILAVGATTHSSDGELGGSGAVYLFDTDTGEMLALADPEALGDAESFRYCGQDVAIWQDLLLISGQKMDVYGHNTGKVYVFDISDPTNPVALPDIYADDGEDGDLFGEAFAVSDDGILVVGAPHDDPFNGAAGGYMQNGSAYVFDLVTGQQLDQIIPSNVDDSDRFGSAVDVDDAHILIGDHESSGGGSAHLYTLGGEELATFTPAAGDVGYKVGLHRDYAFVTAYGHAFAYSLATFEETEVDSGYIYGVSMDADGSSLAVGQYWREMRVYDINGQGCSDADLAAPHGVHDLADITTFTAAFADQDAIADLAAPTGVFDLADTVAFVTAFNAGCQ